VTSESSFAMRLRQGLDDALDRQPDSLPGLVGTGRGSIREQIRRMDAHVEGQAEEDRALAATIRSYRRHPASGWSAVLLGMLAPTLVHLVECQGELPNGVEPSDLEQQIVLEALTTAASLRMLDQPRWVRRHVELAIERRLGRWLANIAEAAPEQGVAQKGRTVLISGVSSDDLALLYRVLVLGQSSTEVARSLRVSARTARRRIRAARLRVAPPLTTRPGRAA
jgi:hypothetical protein